MYLLSLCVFHSFASFSLSSCFLLPCSQFSNLVSQLCDVYTYTSCQWPFLWHPSATKRIFLWDLDLIFHYFACRVISTCKDPHHHPLVWNCAMHIMIDCQLQYDRLIAPLQKPCIYMTKKEIGEICLLMVAHSDLRLSEIVSRELLGLFCRSIWVCLFACHCTANQPLRWHDLRWLKYPKHHEAITSFRFWRTGPSLLICWLLLASWPLPLAAQAQRLHLLHPDQLKFISVGTLASAFALAWN